MLESFHFSKFIESSNKRSRNTLARIVCVVNENSSKF